MNEHKFLEGIYGGRLWKLLFVCLHKYQ